MEQVWFQAALWLVLALVATLLSIGFRIAMALSDIVVGIVAQLVIGALAGSKGLDASAAWITFLAGTGSIVLTFLAGAELDPMIFRRKWKEAMVVGVAGFFSPFRGAAAVEIIDQSQYSHLVATVIGSAVVPTAIANAFFMPRHLLPESSESENAARTVAGVQER